MTAGATLNAHRAATATMRAGVVTGPRQATVLQTDRPEPGPGQVLVRLEGCGVCGSNLPFWEGREWFAYPGAPGAPGHEGWGVVEAVGAKTGEITVGDRVALLSSRAFAEYDIADVDAVVRLPDALRGRPFPGEPLGCAVNVVRRSEIGQAQTVVVIGIGFLGAVVTRLAAAAGAEVIAVSRRAFALEIARSLGAVEALSIGDRDGVLRAVRERTAGRLADRVIEATGLQEPLDLAGELTRERGRLVIAGFHQDGPRRVDLQLWNWRGLDVINAHERDPATYVDGMRGAVDAVMRGVLDPALLLTHSYSLDRLGEALDAMRTRPEGFLKAMVTL